MSDDNIDIEEHDLLENPVIRNMFPDLSKLKQEIDSYDNEEVPSFISRQPKEYDQKEPKEEDQKEPKQENAFHRNKIILGSKPSKPQEIECEEIFEETTNLSGGYVKLHDLDPYLQKCERYCSRCLILFPSKITHENHNECVHLEPRDSYLIEKPRQSNNRTWKTKVKDQLPVKPRIPSIEVKKASNLTAKQKKPLLTTKRWQCEKCNRVFFQGSSYYQHSKADRCMKGWKCIHCKKVFLNYNTYYAHTKANKCEKAWECEQCKTIFTGKSSYYAHRKADKCTKLENWQCDKCNKIFLHASNYHRHCKEFKCTMPATKEQKGKECTTSAKETPKNDKTTHKKQLSVKKSNWQCYQCKYVFFRWNNYYDHRKANRCAKAWKCEQCSATFTAKSSYDRHRKGNKCTKLNNKGNWQCNRCNKTFVHASNYYRHRKEITCTNPVTKKQSSKTVTVKLVQNNGKSKVCSHCNVTFPNEETLIEHMYSLLQMHKVSEVSKVKPTNKDSTSQIGSSYNRNMQSVKSTAKNNPTQTSRTQNRKSDSRISQDKAKNRNMQSSKHTAKSNPIQIKNSSSEISQNKANVKNNVDIVKERSKAIYRCSECSYCFTTAQFCFVHLKTKHNIIRPAESLKPTQFEPQCLYCPGLYNSSKSLNVHLNSRHKDLINSENSAVKSQNKTIVFTKDPCEIETEANQITKDPGESHCKTIQTPKDSREIKSKPETYELADSHSQNFKTNQCSKEVLEDISPSPIEELVRLEHSNATLTSNITELQHLEGKPFESKTADVSLVLKSTLFKCNKCDIHFTCAKMAINHSGHMELLINWKCKKCNRIFKKEDEKLHEKQHLTCNDYVVHDFNHSRISDLSKVLYKCDKCAVHFNENVFFTHFMRCGLDELDSRYCKWCDILIDQTISKFHKLLHGEGNVDDLVIVEADILMDEQTTEVNRTSLKSLQGTKRKSGSCSNDLPRKKPNLMLNMCYCDTCKCYLIETFKHDVHLESRCGHIVKYVCKYCGLVLTNKSSQSHKNLHKIMKNLKLQDFSFFDMRSGEKICPPIPRYPSCGNCDVHFASKKAATAHECNVDVYLTCLICDIKLSELAFRLHMPFHKYHDISLYPNEIEMKCTSKKELRTEGTDEIPMNINDDFSDVAVNNVTEKYILSCEENDKTANSINDDDFGTATSSDGILKPYLSASIGNEICQNIIKNTANNNVECEVATKFLDVNKHVPLNDFILFSCMSCEVVMITYNKVVEHCHWHYGSQENEITSKKCNICNITFDFSCYDDHKKMHLSPKDNIYLYFDTFYSRCGNDVWIKHLFGEMPTEKINKIIGDSIYLSECRVKMEVVQQGEPDLTVFKCDQCQCYVDSSSLYKHAGNSCFKLRNHPCSYCGLTFIASSTQIKHEKIHENREVTSQSYRIVIFNREKDKHFNIRLQSQTKYVLYQCRNCSCVISDKCRIKCHSCNKDEPEKCMKCGLFFDKLNHEYHALKHEYVPDFVVNNMKVILVGTKQTPSNGDQSVTSTSFKGVMKDYTFYSCVQCQTCFQTIRMLLEHVCSFGSNRTNCPECGLYFYSSKIKTHRKLHEIDADFIKENMQIIIMEPRDFPSKLRAGGVDEVTLEHPSVPNTNESKYVEFKNQDDEPSTKCFEKLSDRTKRTKLVSDIDSVCSVQGCKEKTKSVVEVSSVNQDIHEDPHPVAEQIATIYKCFCGLHFLDKLSITSHMKVCNLRIKAKRQKCSKCGLKFTPNILFSHLLQHHGSKKVVYKFNIIEPTATMEKSNKIAKDFLSYFKCSKCATHFVEEDTARKHFQMCHGGSSNAKICKVCNILFHSDTYIAHVGNCLPQDQKNLTVFSISDGSLVSKSDGSNIRDSDKTIYKCKECNIHYLSSKSIKLHLSKDNEHFNKVQDICNICGLNFVSSTLAQHILIHHTKSNVKPNEFIVKEY